MDANCTNTEGSFHCTCHTGYSGDGVTCNGNLHLEFQRISRELWPINRCQRIWQKQTTVHIYSTFNLSLDVVNVFLSTFHFQILTNVFLIKYQMNIFILLTIATLMQTVPIPKDHFIARVIRDTLEMESHVLVKKFVFTL